MRLLPPAEFLPGEPVTNAEMESRFGLHEKWLSMMTGNRTRHFCSAEPAAGQASSTRELATQAGRRALAAAGAEPADIEFVILTTASPDHLMPATVNLVVDDLGIDGVTTMQITSGCAGAIQGLFAAHALLASGLRRGLVIGADSCLKVFPSADRIKSMRPAELINFALFGDGAGAVVVDDDHTGPGYLVEHIFTRCIGAGRQPAQLIRYYGSEGCPTVDGPHGPTPAEPWGQEDYKAIEQHVPELAATILDELSRATGTRLTDVEHVLVPQLNGAVTERIRQRLGVAPERAVSCVAETGNNGNALPFIQLSRTANRIGDGIGVGGRIFVANVESSKWLVGGLALRHVPEAA